MQDIDQNMDDLFRKAAADYPLKLNESQWDDIALLPERGQSNKAVKKNISKKYTGLLVIFLSLLLTTGLITNRFQANKQITLPSPQVENKTIITGVTDEAADYTRNKTTEKKQAKQKYYTSQPTLRSLTDHASLVEKKETTQIKLKNEVPFKTNNTYPLETSLANTNSVTKNTTESNDITPVAEKDPQAEGTGTEVGNDRLNQTGNQLAIEKPNEKKAPGRNKGIYFGAVAGPLFDEVRNQGLKKTGFSTGIITGYKFKKYLSVETGILFAKKPYFSTGKYFSMDKIGSSMPVGMEILSLEGNNLVLEIPVKLKYDFFYRNKRNIFISAGITSYIKTHERNNYLVMMNGLQQSMISSYKNKSRSLAATFDISIGYEQKISKSNHIRIEPYLQIPLKGMGVGSMSMISTGFRLGLTKFTR
jgi:hypothetical protein